MSKRFDITVNGALRYVLRQIAYSAIEQISRFLSSIDTTNNFALSIWMVPEGKHLDELPKGWPWEYL